MAEKYSVDKVPSAARLADARLYNRYNVEIDELDEVTAERIQKLCSEHNLFSEIEADRAPGLYKISIANANLSIIERIEAILNNSDK
jgi:hypothetical protein